MLPIHVDIWSDIACPWCYVGKRRFEKALAKFPQAEAIQVTWRAFELNPSAPKEETGGGYSERLAKKYRTSTRDAEAMISRLTDVAKAEGLDFDFSIIRPGNTFDAHRLLHLAHAHDIQDAVKERFLRAYFCEGEAIGDHETLVRLCTEAGLKADLAREVLAGDSYADDVREEEAMARELGINGVPFFVVAEHYGVSGAQTPEVLLQVLEQAQQALAQPAAKYSEGAVCGPEGC